MKLKQSDILSKSNSNKQQTTQENGIQQLQNGEQYVPNKLKVLNLKPNSSLVRLQNEIEFEDEILKQENGEEKHKMQKETNYDKNNVAYIQNFGKQNDEIKENETSNVQNFDIQWNSGIETTQNTINLKISLVPVPSWRVCCCAYCVALQNCRLNYVSNQQDHAAFFYLNQIDSFQQKTILPNWCVNCQSGCYPYYTVYCNSPVCCCFPGWL